MTEATSKENLPPKLRQTPDGDIDVNSLADLLEWWARLDKAAQKHKITWEWVKGHAGHDVQEIVDTLARKTAELGKVDETMFDELVAEIGVKEI